MNGKLFIGSGKNIQGIINSQAFQRKMGSHMNKILQKDYNTYGESNFSFTVLDYLNPNGDPVYNYTEDLKVLFDMWLLKLQPYGEKGYHTVYKKETRENE